MLDVQFSDASQATVAGYFAGPQDASIYPNLGTVETNDPRWAAYFNSVPAGFREGLPIPTN